MRLKRLFDVIGAAGGLLFFLPAMTVVSIAILIEDGFPVIFRQQRLGRGRRPFTILKFRSMRDGRVTRVGAVLRGTGLDELPQFVNVLQGRMSIVGPRPHAVAHNEEYRQLIKGYMLRHKAPPGIKLVRVNLKTGLPAGPGDPKAIMEAFKPTQEPLGAVATDTEGMPQEELGQAAPQAAFQVPGQVPGPPPPGPFQAPGNDRALTSGTGGLY